MRLSEPRWLLCLICLLAGLLNAHAALAQSVNLVPNRKSQSDNELYRFDQGTVWALQLKPSVVVHSPLLRLKDVAVPVENNPPWWDRVGNAVIAMMPLNDREMIVERARLADALTRSTAVATIEWSGEQQVRVVYERPVTSHETSTAGQQQPRANAVTQTAARLPLASPTESALPSTDASTTESTSPVVSIAERDRIIRFIHVGIDRYDLNLRAVYDITIDPQQAGIAQLKDLRQIDALTWLAEPCEGLCTAEVTARNQKQSVTAKIDIQLSCRPMVVIAREGLRRGHVISSADVELAPAERNLSVRDAIVAIDDVIGLQAQTLLTKGKPILKNSVGPVMLVERGDLVEVRVVGGGITIATSGRSLDRGAQGALIPVETLEPRKKLMARVAAPGIVEIITRPPRVQ